MLTLRLSVGFYFFLSLLGFFNEGSSCVFLTSEAERSYPRSLSAVKPQTRGKNQARQGFASKLALALSFAQLALEADLLKKKKLSCLYIN